MIIGIWRLRELDGDKDGNNRDGDRHRESSGRLRINYAPKSKISARPRSNLQEGKYI